jgi:hypothetical protein
MRLPAAFNRLLGRTAPPLHVRRFDGAAGGRRGWGQGTFGRIGTETMAAGPTLRARARYLANNNPWISQAVGNWVGALVGAGIEPTGEPDAVAVYNAWADQADADGRTDFRGRWWPMAKRFASYSTRRKAPACA